MDQNRCICCGDIVPEGRMVCPRCENAATNYQYILPARQCGKCCVTRMVEKWKKLIESKN